MRSIIQSGKFCIITKENNGPLHKHHCINGGLRSWADREGLWVYLREDIHRELHDRNPALERELKRVAQYCYERTHSREEWMSHVRKNYLTSPLTDAELEKYGLVEQEPYDNSSDDISQLLG